MGPVYFIPLIPLTAAMLIGGEHGSDATIGTSGTHTMLNGGTIRMWHLHGEWMSSQSEIIDLEIQRLAELKRQFGMKRSMQPPLDANTHSRGAFLENNPTQAKKIIFVNSKYGAPKFPLQHCPVQCNITTEESKYADANAAVFNPRWMEPITTVPSSKPKGQKWLFNFFYEAPVYGKTRVAEQMTQSLSSLADWTMTFRRASDIWSPMAKMVALTEEEREQLSKTTQNKPQDFAAGRKNLLLWFVSSCSGGRMKLFQDLAEKLPSDRVHIYGDCGDPSPCPGRNESDACHQALFSKYKFYAAFENSRCKGYITEKFFRPLNEGMVPLVLGGYSTEDYEDLAPRGSFVDASSFSSLDSLAQYLRRVDSDDNIYNEFFRWRTAYRVADPDEVLEGAYCELCQELHKTDVSQKPVKSFKDLSNWWYSACRTEVPEWA